MTKEAIAARREYKRLWAKKNPDKIKAQQRRYWEKRGLQAAAVTGQADKEEAAPPKE